MEEKKESRNNNRKWIGKSQESFKKELKLKPEITLYSIIPFPPYGGINSFCFGCPGAKFGPPFAQTPVLKKFSVPRRV